MRYYNTKVKDIHILEGDAVIKKRLPHHQDPRGKFKLNYEGPYIVRKILSAGENILSDMENEDLFELVNLYKLKRYYI